MRFAIAMFVFGLTQAGSSAVAGEKWRYVVPSASDAFANPPPRILALSSEKPTELKEEVEYRGQRRRYAQLIYGTGRTAPVAIVVDELSDGSVDLYVDADRNRRISPNERMEENVVTWRIPIPVVATEGEKTVEFPRTVYLRYGRVTKTLSVATCGYMEGRVTVDGRAVSVRRVDGDCNGFFGDAQDRVWVNFDDDERWDAVTEQHLFLPILKIDNRKFALRADIRGERLDLAPLLGFGNVQLQMPKSIAKESVEEIHVTLQSRDGVLATLRNLTGAIETPAGDYRVASVMITLTDPKGGSTWGFVFNDNNGREPRWQTLVHGGVLAVDPIGKLEFGLLAPEEAKAGDSFMARPTMHTQDGLLIERAYRGVFESFAQGCHATTSILDSGGKVISSETSGFL